MFDYGNRAVFYLSILTLRIFCKMCGLGIALVGLVWRWRLGFGSVLEAHWNGSLELVSYLVGTLGFDGNLEKRRKTKMKMTMGHLLRKIVFFLRSEKLSSKNFTLGVFFSKFMTSLTRRELWRHTWALLIEITHPITSIWLLAAKNIMKRFHLCLCSYQAHSFNGYSFND